MVLFHYRYSYAPGEHCTLLTSLNHHPGQSCRVLNFSENGSRKSSQHLVIIIPGALSDVLIVVWWLDIVFFHYDKLHMLLKVAPG